MTGSDEWVDTSAGAVAHYRYTLDNAGKPTTMTTAAGRESHTLGALNRLTGVTYANGDWVNSSSVKTVHRGGQVMDARVHAKVVREIDGFSGSVSDLRHVVADLDAIWSSEVWPDEETRCEFRRTWGRLEEIFATVIERRPLELTAIDVARVREQLRRVRELLPVAKSTE